jgi:hypothetical protein
MEDPIDDVTCGPNVTTVREAQVKNAPIGLVLSGENFGFSSGRIGKTVGRKIERILEMDRGDKSLRKTVD